MLSSFINCLHIVFTYWYFIYSLSYSGQYCPGCIVPWWSGGADRKRHGKKSVKSADVSIPSHHSCETKGPTCQILLPSPDVGMDMSHSVNAGIRDDACDWEEVTLAIIDGLVVQVIARPVLMNLAMSMWMLWLWSSLIRLMVRGKTKCKY